MEFRVPGFTWLRVRDSCGSGFRASGSRCFRVLPIAQGKVRGPTPESSATHVAARQNLIIERETPILATWKRRWQREILQRIPRTTKQEQSQARWASLDQLLENEATWLLYSESKHSLFKTPVAQLSFQQGDTSRSKSRTPYVLLLIAVHIGF